jgi:hypothetical protein
MRMGDIQHKSVDRATPLPGLFATAPCAPTGEESVLVDHRTYRIKPTHMNTHLAIYEEFGLKPQWRHLGEPHAYMFAESGSMNTLVHQWVYENAADREKRRAAMAADPEWQLYVKKLSESGLLERQQTSLMVPAKFAPPMKKK